MARQFSFRGLTAALLLLLIGGHATPTPPLCRYLPGDEHWPSSTDWAALNTTVNGRLIATIPQGSVCHRGPYTSYNEAACKDLAAGWEAAQTFEPHPAEMMNAYYQNQSCDPFTPSTQPCRLGNYASYSISVSNADDVIAGFQFAKAKNIRLVVKTTGHDYTGKSSGQGALSLWTWNLKSITITPQYKSNWYSGPAIKLGSGVIVGDAYAAAHAAGYRLVGGECGSVGIASGYTQGGGHSILNTEYGMAADQVLEWELITPTGKHLIATPRENRDLYWALSGGGGGTYGVVLSMTAKIYPESSMAGGSLMFTNTNTSAYWEAVSQWFQQSPAFLYSPSNNTVLSNNIIFLILDHAFEALAITMPNQNETAVHALLSGYLATLDRLGIQYQLKTTYFDSYYDHFNAYFGPLPYGPNNPTTILMNRIIPKAATSSPEGAARLTDAWRSTVAGGDFLVGCSLMNVAGKNYTSNAVLPAWRDTNVACNVNAFWNYTAPLEKNLAMKRRLSEVHMPVIEAATPGGGIYLNEMDPFYRGDWKKNLFGINYDRLLSIKHKNDPSHLLWGNFSVASDEMYLDANGRLCQV